MPGRIFFRDHRATVTSSEFTVGEFAFPIGDILSARGVKRRSMLPLLQPTRFALVIVTAQGEREVLRERDGYVVFQLAKAIESALREKKGVKADSQRSGANVPQSDFDPSLSPAV